MMVRPHLRTWRNDWGFLGSAELSETHSIESVTAQLSDGPYNRLTAVVYHADADNVDDEEYPVTSLP